MASPIVSGSGPVTDHPSSETYAAHAIDTLNGPPGEIDPVLQSARCYERAREFLTLARDARDAGGPRRPVKLFVKAAMLMRFAAGHWREQARDAERGMRWFNALTETERARWLHIAWRCNARAAGRVDRYRLHDMPSAAQAWEAFKTAQAP